MGYFCIYFPGTLEYECFMVCYPRFTAGFGITPTLVLRLFIHVFGRHSPVHCTTVLVQYFETYQ